MSLLTGAAAGQVQLAAGVGLLRVLPAPDPATVASVRTLALGLGVAWPQGASPADVIPRLDPAQPAAAAVVAGARRLLRGAGYAIVRPGLDRGAASHAGVAAVYAHATAPLRRVADRWVSETCLAVTAGRAVPDWVADGLDALPGLMASADGRAHTVERAVVDLVEAVVLAGRVGEELDAVVVSAGHEGGTAVIAEPPVVCSVQGADLPVGSRVRVRVVSADPADRRVVVALAERSNGVAAAPGL